MMRLAAMLGLLCVLLSSAACSTGQVILPAGQADSTLLETLKSELASGSKIPVPAYARFVNFPAEPMRIGPAPIPLIGIARGGKTYLCPVTETVKDAVGKSVAARFEAPDTRQEPIRSDAFNLEFALERFQLAHDGRPGEADCNLRLKCKILLPNKYKVRQFTLSTEFACEVGDPNAPNPVTIAAVNVAKQFASRIRENDVTTELTAYRTVEWVCSATGHKKDPSIPGRFCPNHEGKEYVQRIALKSGTP